MDDRFRLETPHSSHPRSNSVRLLEVEEAHKNAFRGGKADLEALLEVAIPEDWPQFPEAFELIAGEASTGEKWPGYFFICPCEQSIVGNGGFAGPPKENGEVEIGFEIAPKFRNRGYATSAVRMLMEIALRREVRAVVAHTLPEVNASNAVLRKAGMSFIAEVPNSELGLVWRWILLREATGSYPTQS